MMWQINVRSTRAYAVLAQGFIRSTDRNETDLRAAGFTTKTDERTGELLVKWEGGIWTSVKSLVRQGLI